VGEGIDLALANKESLVVGGELVTALAEATGAQLIPVDSEHSALYQLIGAEPPGTVDRLVLTASGGPFRGRTDLDDVTREEALKHPTWDMGGKITIDSATLMNKGLELIEAHHLFGVPYDRIDVVVHPQSVIHSMVTFVDGATLAQVNWPALFSGAPVAGDLDVQWIHGSRSARRNTDPKIQVHACDPHTFVLRQSKAVHYEAPFLYLFCGNDRALLLDTGATEQSEKFPLRETVDHLLGNWLADHPRGSYELVVAHTHGHGDHTAGDSQFAGRPDTIMVPGDVASVRSFFGFADWPDQIVQFDLGGRVLDVTGIPGHHPASIVVYDP